MTLYYYYEVYPVIKSCNPVILVFLTFTCTANPSTEYESLFPDARTRTQSPVPWAGKSLFRRLFYRTNPSPWPDPPRTNTEVILAALILFLRLFLALPTAA